MNKELAREALKELKEKYPSVERINIGYEGAGDSFDAFWSWDVTYDKGSDEEISAAAIKDEVLRIFDTAIDQLFEVVGANFNNDGSEGTLTVDLVNLDIRMNCYARYTETRFEGESSYLDAE